MTTSPASPTGSRPPQGDDAEDELTFRRLFAATYEDLLRFVERRALPALAEDVVADVFLVAWRRLPDVPAPLEEANAWLFAVAQRTLANQRRADVRRLSLHVRVGQLPTFPTQDHGADVAARLDLARAWSRLSPTDQEALTLTALDGLNGPQAAHVLDISKHHRLQSAPAACTSSAARTPRPCRRTPRERPDAPPRPGRHVTSRSEGVLMNAHHSARDRDGHVDLTALDPADRSRGNRGSSPAAQHALAQILATPRTEMAQVSTAPVRQALAPKRRRLSSSCWRAGLTVATAAAVLGVVGVPALVGGGTGSAFASWTPIPVVVTPAEAAAQQRDCLSSGPDPAGSMVGALTERRGNVTFTLVATSKAVGNCMLLDASAVTGGQEQGAMSWSQADDLPIPPPSGTSVQWGATFSSAAGDFTSAVGRVGPDVRSVRIDVKGQPSIQASVGSGLFSAWWPGRGSNRLALTTTTADGAQSTRSVEPGNR